LGCCDTDARVGEWWENTLVMRAHLGWSEVSQRSLGWEEIDDGEIRFFGQMTPHPEHGLAQPILDLGACRVVPLWLEANGFVEGRGGVAADWHADYDDEVVTRGIVRRLIMRPQILERQPNGRDTSIVGHESAGDIAATSEWSFLPPDSDVLVYLDVPSTDPR
jgi:hypothetical protein